MHIGMSDALLKFEYHLSSNKRDKNLQFFGFFLSKAQALFLVFFLHICLIGKSFFQFIITLFKDTMHHFILFVMSQCC